MVWQKLPYFLYFCMCELLGFSFIERKWARGNSLMLSRWPNYPPARSRETSSLSREEVNCDLWPLQMIISIIISVGKRWISCCTYSEYSRAARVVRSCSAGGRLVEFSGWSFLSLLLIYTARNGMNSVSSTRSIPTCFSGKGSAEKKFSKNSNLWSSLFSK